MNQSVLKTNNIINRNPFEIGGAIAIKDALRSGDLYLPESKKQVSFWNLVYGESESNSKKDQVDDFLRLSEREIPNHAGTISHKQAMDKAHAEYDKYHALTLDEPSLVERHFIEAVQAVKQLEIQNKN